MDDGPNPERTTDVGEFLAGFLTGALVGAAIAMVLTPQSGEDLRHILRATARGVSNRARDAAADLNGRTTDRAKHG